MTAIAGLIHTDQAPIDPAVLQRMRNLLQPYGRDAQHLHREPGAGFLRTLLRTTPEDSLDRQPLVHAESQTLILFDGRLDNRDELAQALGIPSDQLRLMADSALALHACLRWETDAVDRLLGDFALACWQPRQSRLWLARDPLGTRPLYWHQTPRHFAFASLPKALFAIPGVEKAICEERLHDYLCLLPMIGPESFYKDIYRVEPGQILVLDGERVETRRYHRWDAETELKLPSDAAYLEAFSAELERAVACRLRSSGPIASHLSSGFDSSTVTALAAQQLAARSQRLIAYTAVPREGFAGPVPRNRHGDEGPGAKALAALCQHRPPPDPLQRHQPAGASGRRHRDPRPPAAEPLQHGLGPGHPARRRPPRHQGAAHRPDGQHDHLLHRRPPAATPARPRPTAHLVARGPRAQARHRYALARPARAVARPLPAALAVAAPRTAARRARLGDHRLHRHRPSLPAAHGSPGPGARHRLGPQLPALGRRAAHAHRRARSPRQWRLRGRRQCRRSGDARPHRRPAPDRALSLDSGHPVPAQRSDALAPASTDERAAAAGDPTRQDQGLSGRLLV
ncbi:MAG: hypothetical protein IT487_11525 [Chromatiaceae bacterium]|nr:hypothetical protein [Chromatiaceae bacterium]